MVLVSIILLITLLASAAVAARYHAPAPPPVIVQPVRPLPRYVVAPIHTVPANASFSANSLAGGKTNAIVSTATGPFPDGEVFTRARSVYVYNNSAVAINVYFSLCTNSTTPNTFLRFVLYPGVSCLTSSKGIFPVVTRAGIPDGNGSPDPDDEDQIGIILGSHKLMDDPCLQFMVTLEPANAAAGTFIVEYRATI